MVGFLHFFDMCFSMFNIYDRVMLSSLCISACLKHFGRLNISFPDIYLLWNFSFILQDLSTENKSLSILISLDVIFLLLKLKVVLKISYLSGLYTSFPSLLLPCQLHSCPSIFYRICDLLFKCVCVCLHSI